MKTLGIVMPIGNEQEEIEAFLTHVLYIVRNRLNCKTTLYLVFDNYSTDGTLDIVKRMNTEHEEIDINFNVESDGLASCYICGYQEALSDRCDYIIEMDAGYSHPPNKIPEIVRNLELGYDAVFMSRFLLPGGYVGSIKRKLISLLGSFIFNKYLGYNINDATSSFHGFKSDLLSKIPFDKFVGKGHIFQSELKFYVCQHTWKITELPFMYTASGSSLRNSELIESLRVLRYLKKNKKKQFEVTSNTR